MISSASLFFKEYSLELDVVLLLFTVEFIVELGEFEHLCNLPLDNGNYFKLKSYRFNLACLPLLFCINFLSLFL